MSLLDLNNASDSNEWSSSGQFAPENFGGEKVGFKANFDALSDWWNNSALNPGKWQSKIQNFLGIGGLNSANSQAKIKYTKSGIAYDETNPDSMINALNTEYANKRDDQAYTRLIQQLKANGINPALVLGNTSAMSSDSGFRSSYSLTTKDQINSALKAGTLIVLLMKLLA